MRRLFNYYWAGSPDDEGDSASQVEDQAVELEDEKSKTDDDAEALVDNEVEHDAAAAAAAVEVDEVEVSINAGNLNSAEQTSTVEEPGEGLHAAATPEVDVDISSQINSPDRVEVLAKESDDEGDTQTSPDAESAAVMSISAEKISLETAAVGAQINSDTVTKEQADTDASISVDKKVSVVPMDQIIAEKHVNFDSDNTKQEMKMQQVQMFEQITDDLVIPKTTISPPIETESKTGESNLLHEEIEREDDVYPKAKKFLAEISVVDEEDQTQTIPPEQAAQIIGFDDGDDSQTVLTTRTTATTVSRRVQTQITTSSVGEGGKTYEHQSLFDILDRNFEELGDAGVGFRDVKLCFVAFSVVFAPSDSVVDEGAPVAASAPAAASNGAATPNDEHEDNGGHMPEHEQAKLQLINAEEEARKKVYRPNVPLSVAFALWRQVLRSSPGKDDTTTLSYIRSTLVLLGLVELSSIDREDVAVHVIANNRRNVPKSSCIECLRLHHDINQQYGEYLAYGDHDESFKSIVETHVRKWNDAVMEEAITMGSNEYTIRMQPLNTMRAYHMQDAFDLLKDKSFVRKRVRVLGASEAALAHIRDIDELLRLIDKRMQSNDPVVEPVDEQDGVLSAFEQLKRYCIHTSNELTKHNTEGETGDNTETATAHSLDKTTLSKIRDVGKALHLIGTSLGGYGFFDQEMEYYNESLRLKELCARNKLDHVSISDTLHCMGFSMDNAGRSEEALEFYDRALDIRYEQLGDDDLRVAETLHNKGALLCDEETSEEAMECLEEALRIRELHYGEEHESCADTMQWMGNLLRQYGDPSDALEYFKFALRIKQIRLGPDHIDVANTLFNTAVLLDDVEKYDLSLHAYKEACRIRKLVLGEKNQDVADTLFCLGNVANAMESHEDAMEYFNESIQIMEALLKDDDVYYGETNDSLLFISTPYSIKPGLLDQYQKLNKCLEEVLPLTKLLVGSNHGDVCKLLNRMGDVYKRLHDWDNAIGSFQGALRVKRADEDVDNDDTEVATLLQKKGEVHLYKTEFSRAKSTFDASMKIRENLLGRDTSAFASSLYCLGVAHHCLKDYQHSKVLLQESVKIQTKLHKKCSLRVAQSLCWLGRNHQSLCEPNKALEKYLSALQHCKSNKNATDYRMVVMVLHTIGEIYESDKVNQPDMAYKCYTEEINMIESKLDTQEMVIARQLALAHYKAGLLCQAQEDVNESIVHLEKGRTSIKQTEGDNQDTEAMIADTLGVLYASKEDYIKAKQYFSDSYSLYEQTLGREHITTSDCAFRLAECLEHVGSNLALDFYLESLRVHRLHIDNDDERAGTLLFSIGRVHLSKDAFLDAVTSFDEALGIRKRVFGDSIVLAETYHQLANAHVQLHQCEKALIYYKESIRIIKKVGGNKGTLYQVSLDMANCCEDIENYSFAIECYNDCLQATEELNSKQNIAVVLRRMGEIHMNKLHNYADATKLFLDALELLRSESDQELSDEDEFIALGLTFQLGQVYALAREFEQALDFYEEHIKLVESIEPVNEELVADSLLEMGVILADMHENSDYELSVEKLKECLIIRRKVLGTESEKVADVLLKLAAVYERTEEFNEAVKCLTEALRTYKMTHQIAKSSNTYHALAKIKANAAEKSNSEADRKAAIECYEAAINTRRQDPSLDDLELASMLYEFATLLCLDNSYNEALPRLEEALRIQKSKRGLRDERVANILLRKAECHVHSNKFDSSLVCLEQVIFIQESLAFDIDTVLLNHLLGITYLERGDYEKSISTSVAALKRMKMEFNQNSLECADIYNNLGKAYGRLNAYDNAIESLVEALRIQKVELGNDSIEYGETVLHLAEVHISAKKHSQAINCLEESKRVFELFPEEKSSLADALEMKADCHFAMKDYPAAASTFDECICIVERIDPDANKERIASLMHRLGKSYTNDYDDAFASYRESIRLYNEALGSDNLSVANVMYDVGMLTLEDGHNEKAFKCFTEVIRIYTLRDEQHNLKVADALVQIGTIQADNSDYEESTESVNKAMRLYKNELVNDTVEIGKALLLCGRLNDVTGDYEKMMSNFNEALRVFKAAAGETDMNVSIALSNIGVAYSRVQKYSEAIEKSKEALRIRKMHTSNDRDVADSLFNIGNLYYEWGESQEAVPYLKGSLNLYRALLGDEDIAIANCQVKLGTIYYNSGEVDEAVNSFSEALYVCEEAEEDAEQLLIPVYKGLGNCYFSKRDLELALESFASCLKIQKLEFGDDCAEIGDTCDSIGLVYLESGKQAEAIQLYKKALQIHERHHGKTSPQCLASQINISKALMAEDRCDDAVEKLHECIELYSTQGKESEQIAMIYQQIGIALSKSSQHDDAIVAFNKALDLRIKIFGKESTQVAEAMLDLGSALEEHDSDEALTLYDQVISVLQSFPDCDKSKVAGVYSRIAAIFSKENKFETSLDALKQALKLYSQVHGSDSIQVAKILVQLGSVYKNLENMDRAMGCFSEGIKIFRSNATDENVDSLMSQAMVELGKIYGRMNMHDKAIELCTESLRLLKKYPSNQVDASIADVYLTVAEILSDWGKVEQSLRFYEQALKSYEETLGSDSTAAATAHIGIALSHKKLDDPQTALRSFGKALRIHRTEGDRTLFVANDLFEIGQIYDFYGETSKAYQCFQECLKIRQNNLSEDDYSLLAARRYLDKMQRKMDH